MKRGRAPTIKRLIGYCLCTALFLCGLLHTLALKTTAQQRTTAFVTQPKCLSSQEYNQQRFEIGNSDKTKLQAINPILDFSTFLGGGGDDRGISIAVDKDGNQYIAGTTNSTDLPTTNGVSNIHEGGTDIFIAKLNASTSAVEYLTYLGGSGNDEATGIAVDAEGNVYVTGTTDSRDFPTSPNSFQTTGPNGSNAFVIKLNLSSSKLIYSTYLGGSFDDEAYGIALDQFGNAYITGITESYDFPLANAYQRARHNRSDLFVTKLNPKGTAVTYSTFFGGSSDDWGFSVAADNEGNAYITGVTTSSDFFVTNGATQKTPDGVADGFIVQFNTLSTGPESLRYATYLGGSKLDIGLGIAVDSAGAAYVTGITYSPDFPTTDRSFQKNSSGNGDSFAVKLNPDDGTLAYSTYLGGSGADRGFGIAVDSSGNAYIVGATESANFPTLANPAQANLAGRTDAFVAKLNNEGSALSYSTYLGGNGYDDGFGIALDAEGKVYVIGTTDSSRFRATTKVDRIKNVGDNVFVVRLSVNDKTAKRQSVNTTTGNRLIVKRK